MPIQKEKKCALSDGATNTGIQIIDHRGLDLFVGTDSRHHPCSFMDVEYHVDVHLQTSRGIRISLLCYLPFCDHARRKSESVVSNDAMYSTNVAL
jgi:hypothetical protein